MALQNLHEPHMLVRWAYLWILTAARQLAPRARLDTEVGISITATGAEAGATADTVPTLKLLRQLPLKLLLLVRTAVGGSNLLHFRALLSSRAHLHLRSLGRLGDRQKLQLKLQHQLLTRVVPRWRMAQGTVMLSLVPRQSRCSSSSSSTLHFEIRRLRLEVAIAVGMNQFPKEVQSLLWGQRIMIQD